jgi:peroxidase
LPNDENSQFLSGDVRINETVGVATLYTIFVREHNRICDRLLKVDSKILDEDLFQIARNYVVGLIQKIVFDDFLPILLGDNFKTLIDEYASFNRTINPAISV